MPGFDEDEGGKRDRRKRQASERHRLAPVGNPVGAGCAVGASVDEGGETRGGEHGTEHIPLPGVARRLRDHREGAEDKDQAKGDVHEEDPTPRRVSGKHAAEEEPDRTSHARHGRVNPQRPGAMLAFGEGDGDEGQSGRRGEGSAKALQRSRPDEPCRIARQAAAQRSEGEDQDASHEHPTASKDVAGSAPEHEQPPKVIA